ncbi:MAG: hypothetical protein Q8N18_21360 [Opitutaceae bacterium]|nr:hypothetical protein [Opitutaceae bacterium]
MAKKKNLTDHEVARAAYHTLKDEGLVPPQSADEIAALEGEFGVYPKPKVSAASVLKMAKGEAPMPEIAAGTPFPELKSKIKEELGLAARKGGDISAEVWAKMKTDRAKAQHERSKQRV